MDGAATPTPAVLFLVKHNDRELANAAADTIEQLLARGVQVLVEEALAKDLEQRSNIDVDTAMIRLFEPKVSARSQSIEVALPIIYLLANN